MSIGEALGRKIGPLPAGVWALTIAGGIGVAVVIRRRSAADVATVEAGEYADAYAPWEQGGNTTTPGGAGNLYTPPGADDATAPTPEWAADLADSITDLTGGLTGISDGIGQIGTQLEDIYYTLPVPGGPGQGSDGGGRHDNGGGAGAPKPKPKPIPTVRTLRNRYDDRSTRELTAIQRQAQERARAVRQGGISGAGEARTLAAAINRAKAARAEKAENQQEAKARAKAQPETTNRKARR